MKENKLRYAIVPFLLTFILLLITYFGNQWYAEKMGIIGVDYSFIFQGFNDRVPFWDWTIYPYVIAYPFWAFTFFYTAYRSWKNMNVIVAIASVTFIICGVWYFFWQSDVQAWRETSGLFDKTDLDFTEALVMRIYNAAGPRNALPSMHTLMSWLCILAVRMDKKMPNIMKVIIIFIASAIIISTQTLKQHYIIDLIAGIALAEAFYWAFRNSKYVDFLGNLFTKINTKLKIR